MTSRNTAPWLAQLVTAALVVAACAAPLGSGPAGSSTATALPGGTMTIRITGDFICMDVAKCSSGDQSVNVAGYATLLALDAKTLKAVPYLAQSYVATPTAITFTLRTNATFNDGTPVTPTAVKNSLQRMIGVKSSFNVENFGPGPYSVGADTVAGTVTFSVGTPHSGLEYGFVDKLGGIATGIISPAGLANPEQLNAKMFGAGPYTLVEVVQGDHITMKLRPDFAWGPLGITAATPGIPETLVYKVVPNETTAANLYLTGGADFGIAAGPDLERLKADPSVKAKGDPLGNMIVLIPNQSAGRPTADIAVRQALMTAVNPKAFNQAAMDGQGTLSTSVLPPASQCFDSETAKLAPQPSVEGARAVLERAGWMLSGGKLRKDGKTLAITLIGDFRLSAGHEYLQSVWTSMGAEVTLRITDQNTWSTAAAAGKYDLTYHMQANQFPGIGVRDAIFSGAPPPVGRNWVRASDPVLEGAARAAWAATSAGDICRHWGTYQQQLWKGWHVLPLVASPLTYVSKTFDLANIAGKPILPILLQRVR